MPRQRPKGQGNKGESPGAAGRAGKWGIPPGSCGRGERARGGGMRRMAAETRRARPRVPVASRSGGKKKPTKTKQKETKQNQSVSCGARRGRWGWGKFAVEERWRGGEVAFCSLVG